MKAVQSPTRRASAAAASPEEKMPLMVVNLDKEDKV
jgi:hypothetical protein